MTHSSAALGALARRIVLLAALVALPVPIALAGEPSPDLAGVEAMAIDQVEVVQVRAPQPAMAEPAVDLLGAVVRVIEGVAALLVALAGLASLIVGATQSPRGQGLIAALLRWANWLSVLTHKNVAGTFKWPLGPGPSPLRGPPVSAIVCFLLAGSLASAWAEPKAQPSAAPAGVMAPVAEAPKAAAEVSPNLVIPAVQDGQLQADRIERALSAARAAEAALMAVRAQLGVPGVQLPAEFWATREGRAVAVTLAVAGAVVAGSVAALSIAVAVRPDRAVAGP